MTALGSSAVIAWMIYRPCWAMLTFMCQHQRGTARRSLSWRASPRERFPVVSDIPANREWLTGSGDGLLFDPDNAEQLADCLTRAIRDAELRQRVVEPNRQLALARGDRETNMARLAQHYERLVATPC